MKAEKSGKHQDKSNGLLESTDSPHTGLWTYKTEL